MCGISGIVNYNSSHHVKISDLKKITDVIAHRGPDGDGFWLNDNIGFGHRRLSIIDLVGSKQPMSIEDQNFVITYNGEIYNYLEIKEELLSFGYTFKTHGDTEVILKAYEHWGVNCLDKFRGMFAFAIWDNIKSELFIARDHFGIKPLIFYKGTSFFMFGSEIQQFKKHVEFEGAINLEGISNYLSYGYIPAPLTIYKDLYKLEPGNYLRISKTGDVIEQKEYFDVQFKPNYSFTYNQWVDKVEEAINTSVSYHKIADVPLGTFLSGGIDSSLIASSLVENGNSVDAFTMGFANKEFNEVPYAEVVAKQYNLNHHIEFIEMNDVERILPKLVKHYGEPFADSSALPTYYITKKIREYLPVVLSGDGGDEAFGGYYSYQNFLKIKSPHPRKHAYKNYAKTLLKFVGKNYRTTPRTPNFEDWLSVISKFNISETNDLLINRGSESKIDIYKKWYDRGIEQELDVYSLASYMDYKTYMHGDILTKVDIASMMNSLEVRTPLIDVDVVNLMAQIPTKFKISRNYDGSWEKKKILNSIAEKRFGKEFIQRKKQGFGAPLKDWFNKDTHLGKRFDSIINSNDSKLFEFLEINQVQKMTNDKTKFNYNKLYQLFILEEWLCNQ